MKNNKANQIVIIYVTESQKLLLQKLASQRGLSISSLVKTFIQNCIQHQPAQLRENKERGVIL